MRVGAELTRMRVLSDEWGVAVRVPAVDLVPAVDPRYGDGDRLTLERLSLVPRSQLREVTQVLDRHLAARYARRVRASLWILTEKVPDEAIRKGAEFSVCVQELGPNLPHKLTWEEGRVLVAEIDRTVAEVRARERASMGRIFR